MNKSLVESQKSNNTCQPRSIDNQKDINAVQWCSIENQKGINPNPIGLFWGLESIGGGGGAQAPPPPLRSRQLMDRLTWKLAQS